KILEQSDNLISASEVCKENLKIFLNRNLILSSILPLFIDCNFETKILDKYKICMFVSTQSENESVTAHRCSLISLHLKRIFELNGATVHTFSDEEESRVHCVGDDILCYRICDNIDTTVKRDSPKLILCSSVLDKTKGTKLNMSLADYKRLLREELKCAVLHKVACLREEVLESYLSNLVTGCLNLQFLNVNHSAVLKVNVDGPKNTRESAFVLYNHARLCNLLNNFESLIIEGIIPTLPPVSTVDFTLLKHSEEWDLFWLFIHKYPELIREVSSDCMCNFDNKLEIISSFPSHTISKFLHRLSHCLSVYYSRVHILPPSKIPSSKFTSHLLPTLWARIYLLKCVFRVMKSSLQLLNIT
ncbi:DALR anticodon-binding domain-containing protein 3, partial [Armadillidium nasatum]